MNNGVFCLAFTLGSVLLAAPAAAQQPCAKPTAGPVCTDTRIPASMRGHYLEDGAIAAIRDSRALPPSTLEDVELSYDRIQWSYGTTVEACHLGRALASPWLGGAAPVVLDRRGRDEIGAEVRCCRGSERGPALDAEGRCVEKLRFVLDRRERLSVIEDAPRALPGAGTLQRVRDALPGLADIRGRAALSWLTRLGRGWQDEEGQPWLFLGELGTDGFVSPAVELDQGAGFAPLSAGLLGEDPFVLLNGTSYTATLDAFGLTLAEEDAGPRGERIELTPLAEPGFITLSDGLLLQRHPWLGGGRLAVLPHGQAVEVWARTRVRDELDGVRGHWLLVRAAGEIGWVFGGYVGRIGEPAASDSMAVRPWDAAGPEMVFGGSHCAVGPHRPEVQGVGPSRVLIAGLNDDTELDAVCLYPQAGGWLACPLLSRAGELRPAGCGPVRGSHTALPRISASDADGDGVYDLLLGYPNPDVRPFDALTGSFWPSSSFRAE